MWKRPCRSRAWPGAPAGKVSDLQPRTDADIIAWFRKVQRYDEYEVSRKQAAADVKGPLPKALDSQGKDYVQSRMLSLLGGQAGVKTLDLPKPVGGDPRPFEVVGIPLAPGFHVVEIASQKLGTSLLDERHGASRTMYVRTSALVTNLGVHFKLGRENSLAWVTTLDKGMPVAGATVRVSGCNGTEVAKAVTNAQGIANFAGLSSDPPHCAGSDSRNAYFVSARSTVAGVEDLAFTWSDWHKGIEPWRFNVPTSRSAMPDERAHTIFDRTLLRAGETVSMKHLLRTETSKGFGLPEAHAGHAGRHPRGQRPAVHPAHQLAQDRHRRPERREHLRRPAGRQARRLRSAAQGPERRRQRPGNRARSFTTGQFRVEEFRLPVLEGTHQPVREKALINVKSVPTDVQINYVSGGGAVNLPVRVSALVRAKSLSYSDFEEFNFMPPRINRDSGRQGGRRRSHLLAGPAVIADKLPLTLDRNGAGKLTINDIPTHRQPQELLMEATYADPNGEVQTIRSVSTVSAGRRGGGIKTEGWVSSSQKIKFQALALDLTGKVAPGVSLEVNAVARITTTSRKRMVGGFYTYDNKTETKDLGSVCSGKSDSRGLLLCETKLGEPGEVELIVTAKDKRRQHHPGGQQRRTSRARASSGSAAKTTTAWTCCPRRKATSPARWPSSRCACPSASPPRWSRSSAKASSKPRWCSSTARTRRSTCRSRKAGAPTSTSACWPCAAGCARCPGTASSPGATRRRVNGGPPSGTKAANTWRPPRWWT